MDSPARRQATNPPPHLPERAVEQPRVDSRSAQAEHAALRMEIFCDDIDTVTDFYTRVLVFTIVTDQPDGDWPYVAVQRGDIRIGIAYREDSVQVASRRPPTGVELVFEVKDVAAERDRVASLWPLEEDLVPRPWGLTDFRVLDPAGYYVRLTDFDAPHEAASVSVA